MVHAVQASKTKDKAMEDSHTILESSLVCMKCCDKALAFEWA